MKIRLPPPPPAQRVVVLHPKLFVKNLWYTNNSEASKLTTIYKHKHMDESDLYMTRDVISVFTSW